MTLLKHKVATTWHQRKRRALIFLIFKVVKAQKTKKNPNQTYQHKKKNKMQFC